MKRLLPHCRSLTRQLANTPASSAVAPSVKQSTAMEADNNEGVIDLTSDTDEEQEEQEDVPASGKSKGKAKGKGKGKNKATDVKKENMKRAAEASKKDEQSGEVQITSKPVESMEEVTRPAKRSKTSSSSSGKGAAAAGQEEEEEEEEDIEMVGTKGGSELPHNRFICPENTFEPANKAAHEERCKLCYCYVCDRPASDCLEWSDHCHATNSGPTASMWTRLRSRAKPLVLAGKRPPVSGLNQGSPALLSSSSSFSSVFSSLGASSLPALPPGGGALPPPPPPPPPPPALQLPVISCSCQELCQQVRKVTGFCSHSVFGTSVVNPAKRVVYFEHLTAAEAQHAEDIAVEATINYIADSKVYRNHSKSSVAVRDQAKERYLLESRPYFNKTPAGGGKFSVTVARKRDPSLGVVANPWNPKWTPSQASPAAVRLGVLSGIGFTISTLGLSRKAFFDRFVSRAPLPISVWAEDNPVLDPGCLKLKQPEDEKLFEVLAKAHKRQLIDVELKAEYNSNKNLGFFTVDVVLLPSLLARTNLAERSGSSYDGGIDFVQVVERLVLKTVFEKAKTEPKPNPRVSSTLSSSSAAAAAGGSSRSASSPSSSKNKNKNNKKKTGFKRTERSPVRVSSTLSSSSSTAAGASSRSASPSSSKKKTRAPKKSTAIKSWKCPTCSLVNPAADDKCAACGLRRRAATAAASAAQGAGAASSGPVAGSQRARGGGGGGGGSAGGGASSASGANGGGGAGANPDVGVAAAAGAVVGGPGRVFTPSQKGYGGRASTDTTLQGLIHSVRAEETVASQLLHNPGELLKVLENLQHGAVVKQPDCLTVQLFEHQLQAANWMYDHEMLDGGAMQHLWAELPPHPEAPASDGGRSCEFRPCWFSPMLNRFSATNPFTAGIKGGLLCDEMGLGKTAATLTLHLLNPPKTPSEGVPLDEKEWGPITGDQATAVVAPRATSGISKPPGAVVSKGTLVVCKVSLVGQWVEEAKRLCGGALTIYPYHGESRKKDPDFLAKFDVVVTTYGVVHMDATKNKGYPPLRQIRWWRVALDESHTIASGSRITTAVKQLVANRRWCMTGTPCNVKFSDLNGQLAFSGAAGAFRNRDLGEKRPNLETQAEVVAFLRRVVLRHSQGMKLGANSLLGLPAITHKVEVLQLLGKELEAYRQFEKALQKDYLAVRWRLLNSKGSHTMAVLTLLTKFRQACSGGQLLVHQPSPVEAPASSTNGDETEEEEEEEEAGRGVAGSDDSDADSDAGDGATADSMDAFCSVCHELFDSPVKTPCGHAFCQACIAGALSKADGDDEEDEGPCPKCKATVKLDDLAAIGGGGSTGGDSTETGPGVTMETKLKALVEKLGDIHTKDPTSKSLVFSQYNSSLEWLKHALPKKGFQFRTLTGGMSRKQRTNSLRAFANDPPTTVFLLSVRAGAVGINLTQANHVFLLEPMLNLALEKQAIGRVHRLGQTRPVTVTKLVLADSVETRILAMQESQASGGGSESFTAQTGVSGSLARDVAKHLKVEEYNSLFGVNANTVNDGVHAKPSSNAKKAEKKGRR